MYSARNFTANLTERSEHKIGVRSRNISKARFLQKVSNKSNDVPDFTIERWVYRVYNMQNEWTNDDKFEETYISTSADTLRSLRTSNMRRYKLMKFTRNNQ